MVGFLLIIMADATIIYLRVIGEWAGIVLGMIIILITADTGTHGLLGIAEVGTLNQFMHTLTQNLTNVTHTVLSVRTEVLILMTTAMLLVNLLHDHRDNQVMYQPVQPKELVVPVQQ
jgi:hypothetical protein